MAFTRIQQFSAAWLGTAKTSLDVPVPNFGVRKNRVLIVTITIPESVGAITCADLLTNVYTDVALAQGPPRVPAAGEPRLAMFVCPVTTPLGAQQVITLSFPSVTSGVVVVREYQSIDPAVHKVWEDGNTNTAPSSGNITTTVAYTLLVGAVAVKADAVQVPFTPGASWTAFAAGDTGNGTGELALWLEDRIVLATGTYAATGTLGTSTQWHAGIAAFKSKVLLGGASRDTSSGRSRGRAGARLTVTPGPTPPLGGFVR